MKALKNTYHISIPNSKPDLIEALEKVKGTGEYKALSGLVQEWGECHQAVIEKFGDDWREALNDHEPFWLQEMKRLLAGATIVLANGEETPIEKVEEKLDLGSILK